MRKTLQAEQGSSEMREQVNTQGTSSPLAVTYLFIIRVCTQLCHLLSVSFHHSSAPSHSNALLHVHMPMTSMSSCYVTLAAQNVLLLLA